MLPGTGWFIGQIYLNEYCINIVRGGIDVSMNNQMILHLDFNGFIDYHISDNEFSVEYDGYWNSGTDEYGRKELLIPLKDVSDSDKKELCALLTLIKKNKA